MKTLFTILMMSILLTFTYGQQNNTHFIQKRDVIDFNDKSFTNNSNQFWKQISSQQQLLKSEKKIPKQKLDSVCYFKGDEEEMLLDRTVLYSYNSNGEILSSKYYRNEGHQLGSQVDFVFDSIGRQILQKYLIYDYHSNDTLSQSTWEIIYNDSLFHVQLLISRWQNSIKDYVNTSITDFYYSDTSLLYYENYDSSYISSWDSENSIWQLESRSYVELDEDSVEENVEIFKDGFWEKHYKLEWTYEDGIARYLCYKYNEEEELFPYWKTIDFFRNENLEDSYSYNWDTIGQSWVYDSWSAYEFDFAYTIQELVLPPYQDYYDNSAYKMTGANREIWSQEKMNWKLIEKEVNYYSAFIPLGIDSKLKESSFHVFPNPACDFIKIINANSLQIEAEVCNIQGSIMKRQFLYSGETIPVSDLKPGVYLLKVKSDAEMVTAKFVKK